MCWRRLVSRIIEIARESQREPHQYLAFIGD
jgi:hypothetical protein